MAGFPTIVPQADVQADQDVQQQQFQQKATALQQDLLQQQASQVLDSLPKPEPAPTPTPTPTPEVQPSASGNHTMDWLQQQRQAGNTNGWQSFGQGSEWDDKEQGQDVGVPQGTAVPLPQGTVTAVKPWGYGDHMVQVTRPDGSVVEVGHIDQPNVQVGQQLQGGEAVTSRGLPSPISSGPHVEVRLMQNGQYVDPLSATAGGQASVPAESNSPLDVFHAKAQSLLDELGQQAGNLGSAVQSALPGATPGDDAQPPADATATQDQVPSVDSGLGPSLEKASGLPVDVVSQSTGPDSTASLPVPLAEPPPADPWMKVASAIKEAVTGVVPGAATPSSPLDAIQNAAAQAGAPVAPDLTGQQSAVDYATKQGQSMQHGTYVTPFGPFNPQLAPPTPQDEAAGPGSLTSESRVREATPIGPTNRPGGAVGPGELTPPPPVIRDGGTVTADVGGVADRAKAQEYLDMLDRQNAPQPDQTGGSIGLRIQTQLADRNAAANQVSGHALAQVQAAVDSGAIVPEEAAALRDSVNAEAHLANMSGAPEAATKRVTDDFKPIYDSLNGKTFVDGNGTERPLTDAVDALTKYQTDLDRLQSGNRMASAGVNNVADASSGIQGIKAQVGPELWPLVDDANTQRQGILNQLRQDLVDGGLLTQQEANELARESPNYNPVRVSEYYNQALSGKGGQPNSLNVVKSLTEQGSPMDTQPSLQSAMTGVYQGQLAIKINQARNAMIDGAKLDPSLKGLVRQVESDDPAQAGFLARKEGQRLTGVVQGTEPPTGVGATPATTITRYWKGTREVWQVPQVLADVSNGMTAPQVGSVLKFASMLNAPLRVLSTAASPTFVLSRAVWNAVWGFVRTGQNPVEQAVGIANWVRGGPLKNAFLAAGAGMGRAEVGTTGPGLFRAAQTSGQALEKVVNRTGGIILRDKGDVNVGATIANLLTLGPVRSVNEAVNMGPRLAEFQKQIGRGATDAEAALAGRRAITDFSRGGQATVSASHIALFLNDHIRGALDVGRTLRDDPMSRVRLGTLVAMGTAAYAWNRQFGDQIDDVPRYVRDNSMVIMLPGSQSNQQFAPGMQQPSNLRYVAIPLRNLAAPKIAIDAFLDSLRTHSAPDYQNVLSGVLGSFSPVPGNATDLAGLGSSMIPAPIKVPIEQEANYKLFQQQPMVPKSMTDRNLPEPLQYTANTSEVAKRLGAATGKSPIRIDNALQDLFGSGGRLATGAASNVLTGDASAAPGAGLLSGVVKSSGGQMTQDAYDQRDSGLSQLQGQNNDLYMLFAKTGIPIQQPPAILNYQGVQIPLRPQEQLAYQQQKVDLLSSVFQKNPALLTRIQGMAEPQRLAALQEVTKQIDAAILPRVLAGITGPVAKQRAVALQSAGSSKAYVDQGPMVTYAAPAVTSP